MTTLSSPCNRERFIFQILIKKSDSIKAKVSAKRDLSAEISLNASSKVMTDGKICSLFHSCIACLLWPLTQSKVREQSRIISILKQVNQSRQKKKMACTRIHKSEAEPKIKPWLSKFQLNIPVERGDSQAFLRSFLTPARKKRVRLIPRSFQNLYQEGMHEPTSGSPLPHLSLMMWVWNSDCTRQTEKLRGASAAAQWRPM